MKSFFRTFSSLILIFIFGFTAISETVNFKRESFDMKVNYNKISLPGDAVFLRVKIETKDKFLKESFIESFGKAQIFTGSAENFDTNERPVKDSGHSDFYQLNAFKVKYDKKSKKAKTEVLLTGIPLSSFFKTGDYTILITISPFGDKLEEFKLPLTINAKEFVSETIHLDAKNTAIRTNTSDERWKQIEKLNKILDTKNKDGVYQLEPFEAPTKATRRTSFFADRRIFAYNNGNSSTSLHYGIDYGIPKGSEIRACADGKVVMAETRITTGWTTVIEHLPGLYSLYYHQNELKCKLGDTVKKGDLIGYSGMTGLATGPHLHWEMRLNMEAVNPDFFLGDFTFSNY